MDYRKNIAELRQDLVSGDWILFSPKRSRRPNTLAFGKNKADKSYASKSNCPFENILETHKPIFVYNGAKKGDWEATIVANKYPAASHPGSSCAKKFKQGIYQVTDGVGHHDLVVTRDHDRNFAALSSKQACQVFQVFRDRYMMLLGDPCLAYILIFHNWGRAAGASVYHPHYQIISVPVVPPDVEHSLVGSSNYF
ncbi:MAG TPA: hypothetical protein VNK70_01855, partial [Candidatus Paceibacterota bacterium]|nr:hypothetical protein [Candidatus Paceibacterota bacterium]